MTKFTLGFGCSFRRRGRRVAKQLCMSLAFLSLASAAVWAGDLTTELWEATYDGGYGDDWVYGLDIDSQGNVVAAGCITGPPGYYKTGCLLKYPPDGKTPWIETMEMGPVGGHKYDSDDIFYDVTVDSNDNIIVVGQKSGTWTGDSIGSYHLVAVVRKYSPEGALTWERTYQDGAQSAFNMARGVCVDADDNVFVAAQVYTSQGIGYQWAILKYNSDGNVQPGFPVYYNYSPNWEYFDAPYDIVVDKDGNFIAVGFRGVSNGDLDWHVRKYDSSRTLVWEDTYDGANLYEHALGVDVDSNGNVLVAGWTNLGTDNGENGNADWLIIKYRAADGYRLWSRTFESEEGRIEGCMCAAVDGLDNVLVGGYIGMPDGSARWRLERLNGADGSLLAEEVWESEDSSGIDTLALRDRRIAIGGYECDPTDRHMRVALAAVLPPEITLLGDNPLTLEVGTAYVEPGFTARDDFEGDLTAEVVVTGSVDHTVLGAYQLHYNVLASGIDPAEEKIRTVNVVDSISPEITLLGENPMTMEVMTPYVDPGYVGTDNYDGDITEHVVVTGSVEHTLLGRYDLCYNASDSSGNPAEEQTRTVNVVDRTPPVISLLGDNPMILEMGTPYLEQGYTATDNYDGDITGNVEITGSVDHTIPGTYTVRYNVVDSSSNPAEEQARTVNVLDTTPFDIAGIVEPVTGMVQLTWSSRLGETFVVWSCNDLCAGPWRQEATLPARYQFTSWIDTAAAVSKMKFYRIERQ